MADLELTRTASDKSKGTVSGTLIVKGEEFFTVERFGYSALRTGVYLMQKSLKRTGRKVPCLRPVDCPFFTILIHDAFNDNHTSLEGCIGPGLERNAENGSIRRSAEAMDRIMELLGGWPGTMDPDETYTLSVTNNPPGITGTRETYWAQRVPTVKSSYNVVCPIEPTPAASDPPPPEPVPERFRYFNLRDHDDGPLAPYLRGPY